jgi:hypothetical protein
MTETLIRRIELESGLILEFYDRSNRYFGDFHRILVEIEAKLNSDEGTFHLRYKRPLTKMGVAGADIELQKTRMIAQFIETTAVYMRRPEFVAKLIMALNRPNQSLWRRL